MKTFGDLKTSVRQSLFPNGEASNLVAAHDKIMVDALLDLQHFVPCMQMDHVWPVPQCATAYRCGLTVLDAPAGVIKRLQVVDRINADTKLEDPGSPEDWCHAIDYVEVDARDIQAYLQRSNRAGFCLSIGWFFGLGGALGCHRANYPVPTDAGLPQGLSPMPLGYHYPQASTDRKYGRAGKGVWAKERGRIYVAPWIQSSEVVVVSYDGIQTAWTDDSLVSDDPLVERAVFEYLRWHHADRYDRDPEEAARAMMQYEGNPGAGVVGIRPTLIRQCRERTRIREREVSHAMGSAISNGTGPVTLYYNTSQQATATCPNGQSGSPVTITVPAGTVSSTVSVADANQKALGQAQAQAQAQLQCSTVFLSNPQTATAQCQGDGVHPPPDGNPVTVNVPAGAATSTISQADADAQALAQGMAQAKAQLACTWWNSAQTYTAKCPDNQSVTHAETVAAHTYSSTLSQADADAQALAQAKKLAEAAINCDVGPWFNTQQNAIFNRMCPINPHTGVINSVTVEVTVLANKFSSLVSQADANQQAINAGNLYAQQQAALLCATGQSGTFTYTI